MGARSFFTVLLAFLSSTSAFATSWHVEEGDITYGIEQQKHGVALLIANGGRSELRLAPDGIELFAGKVRFPVCTIFQMQLFGMGAPAMSVSVKAGERQVYLLGGCLGPSANLANPLVVTSPLTRVSVAGSRLKPGEPILPSHK